jgi:hypothetical protein
MTEITSGDKSTNPRSGKPDSSIILFEKFLDSLGVTATTGWRWRRRNWIKTHNISGRVYTTRQDIADFERRVMSGEFSKTHTTPRRTKAIQ